MANLLLVSEAGGNFIWDNRDRNDRQTRLAYLAGVILCAALIYKILGRRTYGIHIFHHVCIEFFAQSIVGCATCSAIFAGALEDEKSGRHVASPSL
jgi:hypothetical protein